MTPNVSLSLPVYNGEKYLASAIDSILQQDYTDFELIISDNFSTDGTEQICRDHAARDSRIRYIRNDRNFGAAENFNIGLRASVGRYFKWCAHDDLISTNYLSACVDALDANPGAVLAFGDSKILDAEGNVAGNRRNDLAEINDPDAFARFRKAVKETGHCNEVFGLIRRDVVARTTRLMGPYWSADRTLLQELALMGTFEFVPKAIFYNRHHPDRSILIRNKFSRGSWQSGRTGKRYASEYSSRAAHLLEIAFKYRKSVPLRRTLPFILGWAAKPIHLAHYFIELIGLVSPTLAERVRKVGFRALSGLSHSNDGEKNQTAF